MVAEQKSLSIGAVRFPAVVRPGGCSSPHLAAAGSNLHSLGGKIAEKRAPYRAPTQKGALPANDDFFSGP